MLTKVLRSPATTIVLFALAALLLAGGGIGAAQSAPRVQSGDWGGQVELVDINTAIVENGNAVEGGELMADLLERAGDKVFKVGKKYAEELAVRNTGDIDEYVRVTLRTYWTDGEGKEVQLDPSLVELELGEDGWTVDTEASEAAERTVLYYGDIVAAGDDTAPFLKSVKIDNKVAKAATLVDGKYVYDYEGLQFKIEAKADAVQTHNGDEAMTSAWGRTN